MAVKRFIVTIDRLRLDGVPREDAPALVAALHSELERSLARETANPREWSSAVVSELRPNRVRVSDGPHQTGRALGQAMARELAR
jgi:hypothetical protein